MFQRATVRRAAPGLLTKKNEAIVLQTLQRAQHYRDGPSTFAVLNTLVVCFMGKTKRRNGNDALATHTIRAARQAATCKCQAMYLSRLLTLVS